jgi:hypothetical protein
MRESPVKIDILLDPLLDTTNDEQADAIHSKLITYHAEP